MQSKTTDGGTCYQSSNRTHSHVAIGLFQATVVGFLLGWVVSSCYLEHVDFWEVFSLDDKKPDCLYAINAVQQFTYPFGDLSSTGMISSEGLSIYTMRKFQW